MSKTYTRAEVEQLYQTAHAAQRCNPVSIDTKQAGHRALAQLRDSALEGVQVSALEETIQAAHRALSDAKVPTHDDPDDPASKLHLCGRIRKMDGALGLALEQVATLTRERDEARGSMRLAASERDALRAQVNEARDDVEETDRLYDEVADVLDKAGIPITEDGTKQAERVAALVSQRDALRAQLLGARTRVLHLAAHEIDPDAQTSLDIALTNSDVARDALSTPPAEETSALETMRNPAWCAACPHPPHLGLCTRRNGQTAWSCGCSRQTPHAAAEESAPCENCGAKAGGRLADGTPLCGLCVAGARE